MSDASIHHKINEVVVSFQNKLGICGVLQHSIFVMHAADYQGTTKLTEEVLGDGVLGHTDANGPFFFPCRVLGPHRWQATQTCMALVIFASSF